MSKKTLSFQVSEAYARDVERRIARIDYDSMDMLNAYTGDVIEIVGKKRTVCKCLPLYPQHEGKGIVKIDSFERDNSDVVIGDKVSVRKIKAVDAKKITVTPLSKGTPEIVQKAFRYDLLSYPLSREDSIRVKCYDQTFKFKVVDVVPNADALLVTEKTVFETKTNTV